MVKGPKQAIELVAIDCDGTLLDSRKEVSAGAAEAIAEANAAGIQTALITGRNVDAVRFILDAIELSAPMVGCGGAFIYDPLSRKTLEMHTLPMDKTTELVHICRDYQAVLYLEYLHYAIYEKTNELMEHLNSLHNYNRRRVPSLLAELSSEPVKAMVIGEENISGAIDEIQRRGLFGNFVFADAFSADILPEGVNKGVSLRSLADIQGVSLERVAVIGDWLNDLDMFKVGGTKIAMGNAPAELKAQADLIAPTNDEGGAAWALREIIKINLEDE